MSKKIIIIAAVLVIIGVTGFSAKQKQPAETGTLAQAVATSSSVNEVRPYVDQSAKFSLNLPKGWSMDDKKTSTTTSNIWFRNASSTIVITRHVRTAETNKHIEKLGPGGLLDTIINNIVFGLNQYNLVSTQSIVINGVPYRQVISTYVGSKTKRQATQHLYATIAKDAYYLIGIDVYSDEWQSKKDAILQSINTLKLLP